MTGCNTYLLMSKQKTILYVGGLAEEVDERGLADAFVAFGPVKSVQIPSDFKNQSHRGFGFVEFNEPEDAAEALFNMDGAELLGRVLSVSIAKPAKTKLGSNRAVWDVNEGDGVVGGDEAAAATELTEEEKKAAAAAKAVS